MHSFFHLIALAKDLELLSCIITSNKCFLFHLAKRPVLSEIKIKQAQPSSGEDVFLEISISDFAPRDIRVVWYKEWKQLPDDCNRGNICIGENQLCFLTSKIQFKPNSTDFGKAFRCVVSHPASESSQEKSIVLKDKGKISSPTCEDFPNDLWCFQR